MTFKGSIVAVVTPFKNGRLDVAGLKALARWHVEEGTHGIVVNGTTGESPTTTPDEQDAAVRAVKDAVRGAIPVIAGIGTNDTHKSIAQAVRVEKIGVDGLLLVSPYYNRPVQDGLFAHFGAVAKSVKSPIIIYNIPGRTGVAVAADTMARLMEFTNIVAVKDAGGDLRFAMDLRLKIGARLSILSGEDPLNLPLASVGSCGAISVVANVVPRMMAEMYNAVFDNDFAKAAGIHLELLDLHKGLFVETNPIPVKAALHMMGKVGPEIRLPLTPLSKDKAPALRAILKRHGLVK